MNEAVKSAENLLIMVTSGNAQVQLMSMVLSMQSVKQGAKVNILLCGEAGDMALQDAPNSVTTGQPPKNLSPQGLLQTLLENANVTIEVCALYLPSKQLSEDALLEGVSVADPAAIATLMCDKHTKVVSF